MADAENLNTEAVVPQTERTSKQQAKENENIVRNPTAPSAEHSSLTGHTTEAGIDEDGDGKVGVVHETTVVTDPNSKEAVQIPDHPGVDARGANPLGVHQEPTPEQAFAAGTAPEAVSGEEPARDSDES
jgi:hypothetical protein